MPIAHTSCVSLQLIYIQLSSKRIYKKKLPPSVCGNRLSKPHLVQSLCFLVYIYCSKSKALAQVIAHLIHAEPILTRDSF